MALTLPASRFIDLFARFNSAYIENTRHMKRMIWILVNVIGSKNLHILLADDDKDDREIFCQALGEVADNIQVSTVTNGLELLDVLAKEKNELPDIIFLDLNMPIKRGQECLQEIRDNAHLKNIPIIIYSTSSSKEHIDETYDLGANYYVTKPDSFRELRLIFQKILSLDWSKPFKPAKDQYVLKAQIK